MTDLHRDDGQEVDEGSIDLVALAAVVWRRKAVVGFVTLACLLVAIVYLHVVPYTYTGVAKVTPVPSTASSAGGSGASKLGGLSSLASLAGVSLPSGNSGSMQFQLYLAGLHSRFAADALAKNQKIMKVVFRSEWDEENHRWAPPSGVITTVGRFVKAILGLPNYDWQPPNGARLQQYMDDALKVSDDPKTPVVTITYNNKDPAFAVAFLSAVNDVVDGELRKKSLFRSTQNISYLSGKLRTVTLTEQREAIMQGLSEQERSAMMASTTASFAVDTFGAPSASYRPTNPKPLAVLGGAIVIGIILGIGGALLDLQSLVGGYLVRRRGENLRLRSSSR